MKNIIFVLIIIIALCCKTKTKETKKKNNSNSISEQPTNWEDDEIKLKEKKIKKRQEFGLNMQKKGYNFLCYDHCEEGFGVSEEDLRKHEKRKLFDIKKEIKNDTLRINFKFISDCCQEFVGDVEKDKDTLRLLYGSISFELCDCYCLYNYEYFLPVDKFDYKFIYLGDSLLTNGK